MTNDAVAPAPAAESPWGYRLRLVWFIALVVAYSLWFERHLKAFVSQTAIVGTTVTLFAAWKLVLDALGVAGEKGPADWLRRAFTSPRASGYLGFGTLLFLVAWLCTSSIYLTFEGDARGQTTFEVKQWQGDRLMHEPVVLNSYDRFKGRPYFFHFRNDEVKFEIVKPAGFEPLDIDWGVGSQATIRVPGSFRRKELHLLQIVPGISLHGALPVEDKGLRYRLEIRKVGAVGPNAGVDIEPMLKTVVFTGMPAAELAAAATPAAMDETRREIGRYLTKKHVAAERQAQSIEELLAHPAVRPIDRLVKGEKLHLRLIALKTDEAGARVEELRAEETFTVPDDGASTHTIYLEKSPGGAP